MSFRFTERFQYFLLLGYLHGFRHLGRRIPVPVRLLWTMTLVSSLAGMIFILMLTYTRYYHDSVNITLDTAYIRWTNTFPAISTCISGSSQINGIKMFTRAYLMATNQTLPHKENTYYKFMRNYLFVTPTSPIRPFDYCLQLNSTCGINVDTFKEMVRE